MVIVIGSCEINVTQHRLWKKIILLTIALKRKSNKKMDAITNYNQKGLSNNTYIHACIEYDNPKHSALT